MFFASLFKKRFTEHSLDLVLQRVPDFGTDALSLGLGFDFKEKSSQKCIGLTLDE